jgi:hypothetical protein
MKTPSAHSTSFLGGIMCLAMALFTTQTSLGAIAWTSASGTDTNWSTGGNWLGGLAPGSGDDVKFYDSSPMVTASNIDNIVDLSFGGTIASLQYGNTNGTHTTLITNGATLNLTGTGGLTVGTLTDNGNTQIVNVTITGAGTLNLNNPAANILVDQGRAANGNSTQRGILDMSGLNMFTGNLSAIAVGTTAFGGAANVQNATGTLKLARTNVITASFSGTPIATVTASPTNSIQIGMNNGNAGGTDFLFLGQSNQFFIDSIGVGCLKTTATMLFNSGLNNPVAYFRGTNGDSSRVRFWTIGDMSSSGSSSANANGTNDFTGGTVDILVDTMSLGRDRQGGNTGTSVTRGTLTFTAGIIDANTIYIGNQQFTATANSNPMAGVVNVGGPNAVLKATTLVLGRTSTNTTAAQKTVGTLNINGGTVLANDVLVGLYSLTNIINMAGGTLVVTNSLAITGNPVFLTMTNSVLGLDLTGNPFKGYIATLTTGGATNVIQLSSVPVYANYPAQFPLLKYASLAGNGFNFGLTNVPAGAPGAYLSNNVGNKSIDIYLPVSPAPVITSQPLPFGGPPASTVTLSVTNTGNLPLSYQWYYTNGVTTNALSDANPGPSGTSTLTGSASSVLTIGNAQEGDRGGYFVVITNDFGAATSSLAQVIISSSPIAPIISGPNNQTAIAGNSASIGATVSGFPVPTIQWQFDGTNLSDGLQVDGSTIGGSSSATLTIANIQSPSDQGTYSIIANNSAGSVTNSMLLTVIVAPVITNQPVNAVVTNTHSASFSVTAGGVPVPTYQWNKNGSPISSTLNNTATNATLVIPGAAPSDMGSYSVTIQNAAGSVTSTNATLTVNSTMSAVSFAPANNATGICYDTPLTVVFSQAPVLNALGTVKIFNAANPGTPVDTLDLAAGNPQPRSIGGTSFNSFPVIITNNTAVIYPHLGVLTSNQTYYVTIDDGVFKDSAGAFFAGISDPSVWQFTTKSTGPVDPVNPVVAANGNADFVTVQGALDSLPTSGDTRRVIHIRNGNYLEIVNVTKTNVTFRGESRNGTVVGYPNNNNMNPSTGTRMAFRVNAFEVAIENLTIVNTTAQGGSQAEALMIDSGGSHFILNNAEVDSRQDTILANSGTTQGYFYNSLVQGNFDYIWGGGNVFITNCEIRTIGGTGTPNLAAPRTVSGNTGNWPGYAGLMVSNGFSFVDCQLTRAAGVTNCLMSDHNGQTNGLAAWINCSIDTSCFTNADSTAIGSQLLWEYGCSNLNNTLALDNTASPFIGFTQLDNTDPRLSAAQNATNWLNGWVPQLAPNILTNPVSQSIAGGATATFTVSATGISDPQYQWLKNGANIDGQTNATLTINNANANDVASYSVIVSNAAGTVTSSAATLNVGNTAPTLTPIANQTVNAGISLSLTNVATDPDVPPQTLTFSLLAGPGSVNSASGVFTWRAPASSAGTSNYVAVVVTDNGSPNLSATNSFAVMVNPLTTPTTSSTSFANGQFSMVINGGAGPDYIVQSSSNLVDWKSIFTNPSPTLPFTFTDTNFSAAPMQFYRIFLQP